MKKSDIIAKLIEELTAQRKELNSEIRCIDFNGLHDTQKKQSLSEEISNIDEQISMHLESVFE